MADPPLHDDLAHVARLLGSWSGRGAGEYPTIDSFEYVETITFGHVGKPFLTYSQRTRRLLPDGTHGEPLHAETGYWRFPTPDSVEVTIAHPTGITEVLDGGVERAEETLVIELASTTIARSATAKSVTATARTFRWRGDAVAYDLSMAAVGEPLRHHLAATLQRD